MESPAGECWKSKCRSQSVARGNRATGRAADEPSYHVVHLSDAMTGLDEKAHEFAVDYILPKFGTVCTGADYVAALSQ